MVYFFKDLNELGKFIKLNKDVNTSGRVELGNYSYKEIIPFINNNVENRYIRDYNGNLVLSDKNKPKEKNLTSFSSMKVSGVRMNVFKESNKCVCCGLEGNIFTESIDKFKKKYNKRLSTKDYIIPSTHLSLFYKGELYSEPILMTKDHIVPKSKGGDDSITNMQTMCTLCNGIKSNYYPDKYTKEDEIRFIYSVALYNSKYNKKEINKYKVLCELIKGQHENILKGVTEDYILNIEDKYLDASNKDIKFKLRNKKTHCKINENDISINKKECYDKRKELVLNKDKGKVFFENSFQYGVFFSELNKEISDIYKTYGLKQRKKNLSRLIPVNRTIYCGRYDIGKIMNNVVEDGLYYIKENGILSKDKNEKIESIKLIKIEPTILKYYEDNDFKCSKCGAKGKFFTEKINIKNVESASLLELVDKVSIDGKKINVIRLVNKYKGNKKERCLKCDNCIGKEPKKRK